MSEVKIGYHDWVLVADGEKALFLKNHGDPNHMDLRVERVEEQDNPADRDQGANRPGRMPDAGSSHRSAFEDTDWHELGKVRFADKLADILYKMAHQRRFDRIVLVAPPSTLGELRERVHSEVRNRIGGEIPKTLTNHPIDKIEALLKP